ncbi:MAG: hypothetical protein AABX85_02390 [Nanoarchaeota archaeon]
MNKVLCKKYLAFAVFSFFVFLIMSFVSAIDYGSTQSFSGASHSTSYVNPVNYQTSYQTYYTSSDLSTYWPMLNDAESCVGRQDLILQPTIAGCQPAVVRSDLLAEQNVPVFCQIDAIKLNPLIDIEQIDTIRFTTKASTGVVGAGFHPARAALRTRDRLLGSPIINNVGYAVLILKQNRNESSLPDFVNVTLSGQIRYESGNALGIGRAEFILEQVSDEEWQLEKNKQSFWNGRYSIRLERADANFVDVSIYQGDRKISTIRAEKGKPSRELYLPGFYCQAKLEVTYDEFVSAEREARLEIDGDVIEVYRGSKIINGKCTVNDIIINNNSISGGDSFGNVSISCPSGGRILLNRQPLKTSPDTTITFKLDDGVLYNGKEYVIDDIVAESDLYHLISKIDPSDALIVSSKEIQLLADVKDKQYSKEMDDAFKASIDAYLEVADKYPVEKQKDLTSVQTFGGLALGAAIELAKTYKKSATEIELINKFIQLYPDSTNVNGYRSRLQDLYKIDSAASSNVVYVDNKYRSIRLIALTDPKEKARAAFTIGNNPNLVWINKGEVTDLSLFSQDKKIGALGKMSLTYLSADEARMTAYCVQTVNGKEVIDSSGKTFTFKLAQLGQLGRTTQPGQTMQTICGQAVNLQQIDMKQLARVRLDSGAQNVQNEVNLTIGVGIEKRAIKLSPDKTKDMIKSVNDSIEKWENINDKLGKTVSGLKAACFATSAVLTAKTFIEGMSGKGIARQMVMKGAGGWDAKCKEMISSGTKGYKTMDACLYGERDAIERDVTVRAENIEKVNNKLKEIESPHKSSSGFLGTSATIDRSKAAEAYASFLRKDSSTKNEIIKLPDGTTKTVEQLLNPDKPGMGYENGTYTYDQLKAIHLNILTKQSGGSESLVKNSESALTETARRITENKQGYEELLKANSMSQLGYAKANMLGAKGEQTMYSDVVSAVAIKDKVGFTNPDSKYSTTFVVGSNKLITSGKSTFTIPKGTYIAGLNKVDNKYVINELVMVDGDGKPINDGVKNSEFIGQFSNAFQIKDIASYDQVSYNNHYKNPQVRYYETEPYKGMPAVVPFDLNKGWYAVTKQTLPTMGGIGAFDASGRVSSFWLCNVGANGIEQSEEGGGDDICQLINLNTGQPTNKFAGLSDRDAQSLTGRATMALTDAANQFGDGRSAVKIEGNTIVRGKPALNTPTTQCQDFMSPSDCNVLFNVCDPVICPSSRCNFGGKYPVSNVIDTGIIGSVALCLPNFKGFGGDVYIPVCLTGIHAGIDSFLSVLKAHRDCLQTSLDTGQMTGICDQVTSIYTCEFFWRQVAPIANILLPKMVEWAYHGGSQGSRGGGEYLTVMGAWQNTQKAVDYFTNVYAVNSLKAFQLRSIEEAGGTFCKAYISAKAPNAFKSLIEPDSPPQFSAWFSSTPYTTATIPATNQYKVYYHIYGGKDSGVYYRVYLKSSPQNSYYYTSPIWQVDAGYIQRGNYKDIAKDFTAPAGYSELCVDVNGEEKCGFKQVSTSFAVNQLRDSYVANQIATTGITSEKGCISGETSADNLGALLANTNPQAAIEEVAIPQDYKRGITRICATNNPGSSTEPLRYTDVGYCDNEKIRCWLDKKSVDAAITLENVGVKNATLSELERVQKAALANAGKILTDEQATIAINQFRTNVKNAQSSLKDKSVDETKAGVAGNLSEADNLFGPQLDKLFLLNAYKAEILFLKGRLKELIAIAYWNSQPKPKDDSAKFGITPVPITGQDNNLTNSTDQNGNVIINSQDRPTEFSTLYGLEKGQVIVDGEQKEAEYISLGGKVLPIYLFEKNIILSAVQAKDSKFAGTEPITIGTYAVDGALAVSQAAINSAISSGKIISLSDDLKTQLTKINGLQYSSLKKFIDVAKERYTLDSAIIEVKKRSGSYSDNKQFIDELYGDSILNNIILTKDEYIEINGNGLFNLEENMQYVYNLLISKKALQTAGTLSANLIQYTIGENMDILFNTKRDASAPAHSVNIYLNGEKISWYLVDVATTDDTRFQIQMQTSSFNAILTPIGMVKKDVQSGKYKITIFEDLYNSAYTSANENYRKYASQNFKYLNGATIEGTKIISSISE